MIKSFKIVNYLGESIFIDIKKPEDTGFLIYSVEGLSEPEANISLMPYATFDGSVPTNAVVESREIKINMIFYMDNTAKETIEQLRWKCYRYFPIRKELTFYVTNRAGNADYYIDENGKRQETPEKTFYIKGYVSACDINIFSKQEAASITITCPDPYFTLDEPQPLTYISRVVPLFEFRCSFEAIIPNDPMAPELNYIYGKKGSDGKTYWPFDGDYTITPKTVQQEISTEDTWLERDITVKKTPAKKTKNESGGYTFEVGG